MTSFENWILALKSLPEGRIWYNNFEFDRKAKNLPDSIITELVDAFEIVGFHSTSTDDLISIARKTQKAFLEVLKMFPGRFDQKGTRIPNHCDFYSRIITIRAFIDNNVDIHRLGFPIDDWDDITIWESLGKHVKPKHFINTLRTGRVFFWCTKTCNMDDLRCNYGNETAELALEARNQLGLAHLGEGLPLVEIIIPSYKLTGKTVRAPTCLDAGFPSNVWVPSDDRNGFGWTLNLSTCEKGLEETVIEELPFERDYNAVRVGIIPITLLPAPGLDVLEHSSEERLRLL